jgi:hypothetical protein
MSVFHKRSHYPHQVPAERVSKASSRFCLQAEDTTSFPNRCHTSGVSCTSHLLVVHRNVRNFLSLRVRCRGCHRAGLAVARDNDAAGERRFAILLVREPQHVFTNLPIRPCIDAGVARYWIILPIELSGPFRCERHRRFQVQVTQL